MSKKRVAIIEINECCECRCFEDDDFGGVFCIHSEFPRDENGKCINLTETIDPYEDVHEKCPYLKKC